ncbi:MAG: acyl-protein synthetase [Christensenella sp.]
MESLLHEISQLDPYSLNKKEKSELFGRVLSKLTRHHYDNCEEYKRILDAMECNVEDDLQAYNQPMLPVRLFKEFELRSVPKNEIVKTMTSSGTTGQNVSKIYLDKENTKNQSMALTHIISSFIGKKRLPLLILDTAQVKTDRAMFSARGAGIIGFSLFGFDTLYALNDEMEFDFEKVGAFIEKHKDETILMFGYTYMIWQYVVCELEKKGIHFNMQNALLFHIGGWKKLKDQAVDALAYNERVKATLGNVKVYNYYGMAEQLGSVFVECEYGHMHCSNYSDVIIRRASDFSVADKGERGLIELLSLLPTSYPGHVLLTEDEGEILGEDDCPCKRMGKYFKIYGRIKGAEIRGCSDTYEKH